PSNLFFAVPSPARAAARRLPLAAASQPYHGPLIHSLYRNRAIARQRRHVHADSGCATGLSMAKAKRRRTLQLTRSQILRKREKVKHLKRIQVLKAARSRGDRPTNLYGRAARWLFPHERVEYPGRIAGMCVLLGRTWSALRCYQARGVRGRPLP